MSFDPEKPYNDLPLLPPKEEIETKATLRKAISAGRALAELKGLGETIPNQAILVNSIILQEEKSLAELKPFSGQRIRLKNDITGPKPM